MKKLTKILVIALVFVMIFGTISSSAFEPYETYTYSIDGEPMRSPAAYSVEAVYDTFDMEIYKHDPVNTNIQTPADIVTDNKGNVYISDKENNRIIVLDKYFKTQKIISTYVDEYGKEKQLSAPMGLFITDETKTANNESFIYVCDSKNKQIVVFNRDFTYEKTVKIPEVPVLQDKIIEPQAIAVDIYGRIFVTSHACSKGVMVLSNDGDFTGFIGAQKIQLSFIDQIWRRFQSAEQRKNQAKETADPYNNITVDDNGFVYVTTSFDDEEQKSQQLAALKSKAAGFSPVKKLNSSGKEIMKRNGFFDPSGEIVLNANELSEIVDIAVGPEGSWTILDKSRSRFFTYDDNGNLLFAFGDGGLSGGAMYGNGMDYVGMAYQYVDGEAYFLALDNSDPTKRVTVYRPTPYYNTVINALANQNKHIYSETIRYWTDVLQRNNNFDLAYIGIGKAYLNQGHYEKAQEYLSKAYEVENYSTAFAEIRKEIISKWLVPLVIGAIVLLVLVFKFLGFAKKKNKAVSLKVGQKSYWEELLYAFHLVFHPFDGFWDLKHEKRGSVRAALTFIALTIAAFFYQAIGQGYTFNPRENYSTVAIQVVAVIIPVLLWCVANWCLTTLFDGEGSFKDIVVATGYALAPLPIFVILSTVLTNVMTATESSMVTLLVTFGYIWVGILLFFGMLVTHDYSMNKSLVITIGTILAMLVIMFIIILFFSLVAKMVTFIIAIFSEVGNRL